MSRHGDDLDACTCLAGVHIGPAVDADTGWHAVAVMADAPVVVLDADEARILARYLTLAAEDADRDNDRHNNPKGSTP